MKTGQFNQGEKCSFAHGEKELRNRDQFYKTSICRAFTSSNCSRGELCRLTHGANELRTLSLTLPPKLDLEVEDTKNSQDDEEIVQEARRISQNATELQLALKTQSNKDGAGITTGNQVLVGGNKSRLSNLNVRSNYETDVEKSPVPK